MIYIGREISPRGPYTTNNEMKALMADEEKNLYEER